VQRDGALRIDHGQHLRGRGRAGARVRVRVRVT